MALGCVSAHWWLSHPGGITRALAGGAGCQLHREAWVPPSRSISRRSRHSAKLVSSVRPRGVSTVQSDRICIPRVCIVSVQLPLREGSLGGYTGPLSLLHLLQSQSHREPKQRRRYRVAHLLGGVRCFRASGVFQRPTPVLVPFLLRGQGGWAGLFLGLPGQAGPLPGDRGWPRVWDKWGLGPASRLWQGQGLSQGCLGVEAQLLPWGVSWRALRAGPG